MKIVFPDHDSFHLPSKHLGVDSMHSDIQHLVNNWDVVKSFHPFSEELSKHTASFFHGQASDNSTSNTFKVIRAPRYTSAESMVRLKNLLSFSQKTLEKLPLVLQSFLINCFRHTPSDSGRIIYQIFDSPIVWTNNSSDSPAKMKVAKIAAQDSFCILVNSKVQYDRMVNLFKMFSSCVDATPDTTVSATRNIKSYKKLINHFDWVEGNMSSFRFVMGHFEYDSVRATVQQGQPAKFLNVHLQLCPEEEMRNISNRQLKTKEFALKNVFPNILSIFNLGGIPWAIIMACVGKHGFRYTPAGVLMANFGGSKEVLVEVSSLYALTAGAYFLSAYGSSELHLSNINSPSDLFNNIVGTPKTAIQNTWEASDKSDLSCQYFKDLIDAINRHSAISAKTFGELINHDIQEYFLRETLNKSDAIKRVIGSMFDDFFETQASTQEEPLSKILSKFTTVL